MRIPSKFEFDRRAKTLVASALQCIVEALQLSRYKLAGITCNAHRADIGYVLLTSRPDLIGLLAARAETDAHGAVEMAVAALEELRQIEPLLFWPSHSSKDETRAWIRRERGTLDDENWHAVDRMDTQAAWRRRYSAAFVLRDKGKDPEAIRVEILTALNGKFDTPATVVPVETPGGIIAGPGVPCSKIGGTP